MKNLLFFAAVVLATCVQAATSVTLSAEEAERHQLSMTGGIVRKPGSGKGSIVVLNAQEKVKNEAIRGALDLFNRFMHLPIEVKSGAFSGYPSKAKVADLGATFAIFVTENSACGDALLVAPESNWALVNVSALTNDAPTADRLENRVQKEVVRAFGHLCGAANSTSKGTVMGPVGSYTDLDRIILINYPLDAYQRTIDYLRPLKVVPYVETSYKRACMDGWAEPPTNDYQKAIWEQVKNPAKVFEKDLPELKK